MESIDTKKAVRAAPVALLVLLAALSFVYGLSPFATLRHIGWYAAGDVDAIPVWVLPMSAPLVDLQGNPVDLPPPGGAERVESWSVSSADVVRIMQEHELLTDWWRDEIRLAIDAGLPRDNPVVSSYVGTVSEVGMAFRKLVPDDVLVSEVTDNGRMPGVLQAGGCRPSDRVSADRAMQYYNTGTRQLCDNLIGGTQWLLVISLIVLGVLTTRSRKAG